MKMLLEAGVHFGHQTRYWNPKMSKYIFDERNRIHIIDLQKTVKELKKAYKFIAETAANNKGILFVGTKKQAKTIIETEAKRAGAFYVSEKWLGGTLTNFNTIRKSVARLEELNEMKKNGIFELLSKKEASHREKERIKLEKLLTGIRDMKELPGAVFIVNPVIEKTAVSEARRMKIPIVAICDTDADPDLIDYVIPGNDDAVRSLQLFISVIADAVIEGKSNLNKEQKEETMEKIPSEEGVPLEDAVKEINLNEENKVEMENKNE